MSLDLISQTLSAASKGDTIALRNLRKQINLNNCYDKFGATPVHYAARAGKVDCLRWLVEIAGLNGNRSAHNGATPVHDAAATGQLDCLRWLVEYGGYSETGRDSCGATPLHLAARFGHLNVIAWLVEVKSCSALDRAQNGVTPVHLAAAKGSINCLKWLSQTHPSSVNQRADNGTTPTYFSAQEGKLDCLQFMVTQADADIRLSANDGMSPVHAAAQMGHLDCLSWIIENTDISPNKKDNDGATPMHFAAARGHVKILQWLLSHGCSVETDDLGGTPLHDAAEHGQLEALKVLVASGMDTNVRDFDGLIPADLASECGHTKCAIFLRSPSQIQKVRSNARDYLLKCERTEDSHNTGTSLKTERKISIGGSIESSQRNQKHDITPLETEVPHHTKKSRTQDASLLSEVRMFEPIALKSVPQKKKNLQHIKLGHIPPQGSDESKASTEAKKSRNQVSDVPVWKTALTKKRADQKKDEKHVENNLGTALNQDKTKATEVLIWKRALIDKRAAEKPEHSVIAQPEALSEAEKRKEKFDALPEWKKKLIIKKTIK